MPTTTTLNSQGRIHGKSGKKLGNPKSKYCFRFVGLQDRIMHNTSRPWSHNYLKHHRTAIEATLLLLSISITTRAWHHLDIGLRLRLCFIAHVGTCVYLEVPTHAVIYRDNCFATLMLNHVMLHASTTPYVCLLPSIVNVVSKGRLSNAQYSYIAYEVLHRSQQAIYVHSTS